eukprot:6512383-Alexandrium_andersonii.AAC.1
MCIRDRTSWTKRRRSLRESEMDALMDQGLSLAKDLRDSDARHRARGEDLPPDSPEAWATLARGRRIWEGRSS